MKVKKYLLETVGIEPSDKVTFSSQEDFDEIQSVIDTLKKCGPFYRDIKKEKYCFHRGTFKVDWRETIVHKTTRTDRRPKDTSSILHDVVDDALEKRFGWRPRSQGLFTTSHKGQAVGYGNLFSVWPCGDYKFVWSDEARDLFNGLKAIFKLGYNDMSNETKVRQALKDPAAQKRFKKLIDSFRDDGLGSALRSGNEVVFGCKSYYLVNAQNSKYVGNDDMEDMTTVIEMAWAGKKFFIEDESLLGKEVKFNV